MSLDEKWNVTTSLGKEIEKLIKKEVLLRREKSFDDNPDTDYYGFLSDTEIIDIFKAVLENSVSCTKSCNGYWLKIMFKTLEDLEYPDVVVRYDDPND